MQAQINEAEFRFLASGCCTRVLPPSKKRKALAVQPIYQAWGYIIVETVSTKSLTLPTAFFIFFLVFELLEPIVALALAITEPTAIATPSPFIMFSVFFFIFILLKNFCFAQIPCAILLFANEKELK